MRRRRSGFVPIVDSQRTKRVTGVVNAKDVLLHLVRLDRPASQVTVKACMRESPTISSDADLQEAVRLMKQSAARHLPVVEDGKLVGVLSLQDIAMATRRQWAYIGPHVTEQSVSDILEAIGVAHERNGSPKDKKARKNLDGKRTRRKRRVS